jgi:hypothetical protein
MKQVPGKSLYEVDIEYFDYFFAKKTVSTTGWVWAKTVEEAKSKAYMMYGNDIDIVSIELVED